MPYLKLAYIPAPPPTDGLVFYAPLDSDKATAETGQALTKSGSPTFQVVDGIPCVYLNGADSYIRAPFGSIGNAPRTLSVWIKAPVISTWNLFLYIGMQTPLKSFYIGQAPNMGIGGYTYGNGVNTDIVADRWKNAILDYDGITAHFYLDNVFIGSFEDNLDTTGDYLFIGNSSALMDVGKGNIAGVRVYDHVLSASDRTRLFHEFSKTAAISSSNCLLIGGACLPLEPFEYEAVVLAGTENYEITGTQNTPVTPITFDAAASDGSTVNYAVTEGTLPDGITLSGGTLSGTPAGSGTSTVKITASSGDAALVITVTFSIAAPAVAKCPQNLTGFTSDPDWDVSGTDGAWVVFDGLNEPAPFGVSFNNQGVGVIIPADATVISWARKDGKTFSASSVILKTLHTSLAMPIGDGSAIGNLRLYAVLADGGTVDINSNIPWQSVSGGAVPVSVNPELELCGFVLVMYGGGAAQVYISEIEVE